MTANGELTPALEQLPLASLSARLGQMMTRERHCLAEFLIHLAELDRRRGHSELGYESLFAYCIEFLKMANGTAYRRTTSARLIARFPVIVEHLRDGRLTAASLSELRDVLTAENHREILERACGMSEKEARLLAATLNPKPDVADSIRRVPIRTVAVLGSPDAPATPASGSDAPAHPAASTLEVAPAAQTEATAHGPSVELTLELEAGATTECSKEPEHASEPALAHLGTPGRLELSRVALPPNGADLRPLSAERYAIRMTVSKEFVDEYRQVRDALSHVVPGGKMEDVLRECMRIARGSRAKPARRAPTPNHPLQACDSTLEPKPVAPARDLGPTTSTQEPTPKPDAAIPTTSTLEVIESGRPPSRYIPAAIRREVIARDDGCCAFVGTDGRRCRSRYRLQFHHKVPFGRGGLPTSENLTLYCARHNLHQAYRDYGASHMNRFVSDQLFANPAAYRKVSYDIRATERT